MTASALWFSLLLFFPVLLFLAIASWGRTRMHNRQKQIAAGCDALTPEERYRRDAAMPDRPVPFGPGHRWIAVPAPDARTVAHFLDLKNLYTVNWTHGIERAGRFRRRKVFVTPPVGGWISVVSAGSVADPSSQAGRALLQELRTRFGAACFFAANDWRGLTATDDAAQTDVEAVFEAAKNKTLDPRTLNARTGECPRGVGCVGDLPEPWRCS